MGESDGSDVVKVSYDLILYKKTRGFGVRAEGHPPSEIHNLGLTIALGRAGYQAGDRVSCTICFERKKDIAEQAKEGASFRRR